MAGLLAAVLPGHFLDRTLVGFVDHHALEVLLSFATLACARMGKPSRRSRSSLTPDLRSARSLIPRSLIPAAAAGLLLALYLLAWGSGAYFVAILAGWIVLVPLVGSSRDALQPPLARQRRLPAIALLLVLALQDPGLFRYNTQIAALFGLLGLSALALVVSGTSTRSSIGRQEIVVVNLWPGLARCLSVAAVAASVLAPDLVRQVAHGRGEVSARSRRGWRCSRRGRCFCTPATGSGRSRGCFSAAGSMLA